ncbi:opy2 [Fusarium heterosporum]|uniref:Opy2 n=1 Tax=Fusarium heterosporum TaxID=42747 RepID=A0A8H5T762_FUSHE|nr:opy2 [Fusarium heterosporum]
MMERSGYLIARDLDELSHAFQLVPRSKSCVKCDDDAQLECPKCADNEVCQFTVPLDCTMCATSFCEKDSDSSVDSGSKGPNVGAIVGGVIGGIAMIAIATYVVWRFCIKPKRSQIPTSIYVEDTDAIQSEKDAASRGTRPHSTHTVHSIASTVLTRASNIIQIAYIPGVTNRATPTSPNVLVPPVPPIPMHHHADANRSLGNNDQHFFVPGDLRDSTYSGLSGYSDRTSYARTSYAPRSSVASTIYGKQAQVLTPAQTGMRAKPTVVSVKSVGNNGGELIAPPVPTIDFERFGNSRPKSGASAFSVGSTFLNSANTATQARAQVVKVGTLKKVHVGSKAESETSSSSSMAQSPPSTPNDNATRASSITAIEESPRMDQGPFSDPPERCSPQKSSKAPSLGAVIEDAAGENGKHLSLERRDSSPFGDKHATKE